MTPFELNRYLDYCSDALALISKIAALYVQGFQDPVLLDAVDDVEDLTAGSPGRFGRRSRSWKTCAAHCMAGQRRHRRCQRTRPGRSRFRSEPAVWGEHPIPRSGRGRR